MGKYRNLIDRLYQDDGSLDHEVRAALIQADGRVLPALIYALHNHRNDSVREEVAEILGERGSAKAIAALIRATEDPCLFVRHDALWSIERICLIEPAGLSFWLDLVYDDPKGMKRRVEGWWSANRQFIEGNEAFL